MTYENKDRREVDRLFKEALGKKLTAYETTRAYGYPADEAGTITMHFTDGMESVTIRLSPTGYDADGIYVLGE